MLGLFKKSKKRICVIGLDGVPHSLLKVLMQDGTMPAMAQLCGQGSLQQMKVTLPEISSVSWTSFMTGTGPGEHGIFGFLDLKPGTRQIRFPQWQDVKVPTMWDRLEKKGKRSVVINQPATYPARRFPGIVVSGFVAIDLLKSVYPLRHLGDLKRAGYELDIDTHRARQDTRYLIDSLDSSLEGRRKALDLLWNAEDWDYFQMVVTGTDRLQHYLWNAIEDTSHEYHSAVRAYYSKVDAFIAEIIEHYEKKVGSREQALASLYLLSDHGFTGIKKEFNLNTWLRQEGYQDVAGEGSPSLETLTPESKAFAVDPSRIYFNRKGRFPEGTVEDAAAEALAEEMSQKLLQIDCQGEPVVKEVRLARDVYSGPLVEQGPDLIVLTHYGYDAKGAMDKSEVLSDTDLAGMHTWDDAFFWSGERFKDELNIVDLAAHFEAVLT